METPQSSSAQMSFSRLETYTKCPEKYRHQYLYKTEHTSPFNIHFGIGRTTHTLLQEKLQDGIEATVGFDFYIGRWLREEFLVDENIYDENFSETIKQMAHLLWRASESCKSESEQIRNKDGSVPKDPITHPPKLFNEEFYQCGAKSNARRYDQKAAECNPYFLKDSFSWVLASVLYMAHYFETPNWVSRTLFTEYAISNSESNRVTLPNTDVVVIGYIDWVVRLNDGRLAIVDHKTGTQAPTGLEVLNHLQLNFYAWAWECIFGESVDIIGINHARSGKVILAETDKTIVHNTIEYLSDKWRRAQGYEGAKYHPSEYKSPCTTRDYKTKSLEDCCPFLSKCWPYYYKQLQLTGEL